MIGDRDRANGLVDGFECYLTPTADDLHRVLTKGMVPEAWSRDTEADPILGRLRQVLAGRVGAPLDNDDYQVALKEAHRRIEKKEPPGYRDSAKDGELGAGDYLIWEQTLREAERQTCDVLFVTGDGKEDWWRDSGGQRRGPRAELAREMRDRAGTRLFMMRPTGLLVDANRHLDVPVREESLDNVDAFDRILDADEQRLEFDGGWSMVALGRLLVRLEHEAPVQAATIKTAVLAGGLVSRDKVYELGEYEPTRKLRGFTRPVTRISQDLKSEGLVHPQAVDVLVTKYDPQAQDFGWATGFEVPEVLLANLSAAIEDTDDDAAHPRDESVSGHAIDLEARTRK